MSRCLVIGAGVMGLCQAHSLALRHQVVLMPSPYDQINVQDGAIQSPFGAIDSSVSLFDSDHSTDFDFVFVATSVSGLPWVQEIVTHHALDRLIVLAKGWAINNASLECPFEILMKLHSVCHIAVISGPCLAKDLYHGLGVWNDIAASSSSFLADCLACLVDEGYHLNPVSCLYAISMFGALKNCYAIAIAGFLQQSISLAAAKTIHAVNEMNAFYAQYQSIKAFEPDLSIVHGVCGAGDLMLTAQGGRNGRLGSLLAQHGCINTALKDLEGVTLEGYALAQKLQQCDQIDFQQLPMLKSLLSVLLGDKEFSCLL